MSKKIVIGADHGGFNLKEEIKRVLITSKYPVNDVGSDSDRSCDYPIFGYKAAKEVSDKKAAKGIVICKSGIGMSMVANKLPGVRAALCFTAKEAESARKHNDANMLVLSASKLSTKEAVNIVLVWMRTKALKGRHARRVEQIKEIEKKVFKKRSG
ncbi:MAG: RpiB/LacA/LacB family sugar-phosphate isomerase [Candidatus Omnitrophota bacterium]